MPWSRCEGLSWLAKSRESWSHSISSCSWCLVTGGLGQVGGVGRGVDTASVWQAVSVVGAFTRRVTSVLCKSRRGSSSVLSDSLTLSVEPTLFTTLDSLPLTDSSVEVETFTDTFSSLSHTLNSISDLGSHTLVTSSITSRGVDLIGSDCVLGVLIGLLVGDNSERE